MRARARRSMLAGPARLPPRPSPVLVLPAATAHALDEAGSQSFRPGR